MGDGTSISWTDATWNPVRGCSRVSEGCRNCYAERMAARFSGPGQPYEGLATAIAPRDSLDAIGGRRSGWTREVRLIPEHLADPLRWKKPRRIFVNSMSDLFHEKLTNERIAAVFGVMAAAPQHTFQVLTKRAKRMRQWFQWAAHLDEDAWTECHAAALVHDVDDTIHRRSDEASGRPWPLPNVWLGVSVENQEAADERIPELLRTPAAVRFLSCEPLLGLVDLHKVQIPGCASGLGFSSLQRHHDDRFGQSDTILDWVIAGCESGPGARECKVEWLRSLRDQCAATGVPYFLKQAEGRSRPSIPGTRHIGAVIDYHDPSDGAVGIGVGSKRKGRGVVELPYLDGVQHAAFPTA